MEESAGVDLPVAVCVYVPAGVGEALSSLLVGLLLDRGAAVHFVLFVHLALLSCEKQVELRL